MPRPPREAAARSQRTAREDLRLGFVDLFAGAGGLTEGLKQAGLVPLAAVEHDPLFARSYEARR